VQIYSRRSRLARSVFWQRLEEIHKYVREFASEDDRVLDLGGGSGAFLKGLCAFFRHVELVDLDSVDARRIASYLRLSNVQIHECDIRDFEPPEPYDVILAADVLEHFQDLNVPLQFFKRVLRETGGTLFVSLPTENWVYRLARAITNKTKPPDHYHSASQVLEFLENHGFTIIGRRWCPTFVIPLPLFQIAVLRWSAS
jgi:trans-aconitate methyltransferase